MVITVSKEGVFKDISMISEYVADKGNDYLRIALVDENRELFDLWWNECCNSLLVFYKYWLLDIEYSESGDFIVELNLLMEDDDKQNQVMDLTRAFIVNSLLSRWLMMCKSDQSAVYDSVASGKIMELKNLIYFRKPVCYEEN